tara:strand:+ start:77 stop:457 length:381 start_codon:yes stop_codon:yes gene_type:complete
MKNLKQLTDKQIESRLIKAYNSSNYELVEVLEEEQRLRYSDWEKQFVKTALITGFIPKKVDNHKIVTFGNYEGIEYKKEISFDSKGSRTRYYVDGIEVTNEKRSKAKEIIFNLKINKKQKQYEQTI